MNNHCASKSIDVQFAEVALGYILHLLYSTQFLVYYSTSNIFRDELYEVFFNQNKCSAICVNINTCFVTLK